jgi:hypothetical protein
MTATPEGNEDSTVPDYHISSIPLTLTISRQQDLTLHFIQNASGIYGTKVCSSAGYIQTSLGSPSNREVLHNLCASLNS